MEQNLKYIYENDLYYRVRIRIGKITYDRSFAFEKYGGQEFALDEAIFDRDRQLKCNGLMHRLAFEYSPRKYCYTKSNPIVGVYKSKGYWIVSVGRDRGFVDIPVIFPVSR